MASKKSFDPAMGERLKESTSFSAEVRRTDFGDYDAMSLVERGTAYEDRHRMKLSYDALQERVHEEVRLQRAQVIGRGRGKKRKWPREEDYHSSAVFNKKQYVRLSEVAFEKRVPLKDLMYDIFAEYIERFERESAQGH